jgi:polar amino acid transport system permease protein
MDFLQGYGGQMGMGALVTLAVAGVSVVAGILLGILAASAKLSARPWISWPAVGLTNLIRGVPDFLVLLICYFTLPRLLTQLLGTEVSIGPFAAGVIALSIVFGAYSSEVFRGAFLAVPKGQTEAAAAFGMSPLQSFVRVRLPQAWRYALPGLNNLWQSLLKDTSLVSVVGLEELLGKAKIGAQVTKQPFAFYFAASLLFLAMWGVSIPIFAALERRANRGVRPLR